VQGDGEETAGTNEEVRGGPEVGNAEIPRTVGSTLPLTWERRRERNGSEVELRQTPQEVLPERLRALPHPARFVTEYEPHLRHQAIEEVVSLFERLRHSLGRPDAATRLEQLKLYLTETYRHSVADPETRDFATAISMLQDVLRPHWSELSPGTLDEVSTVLEELRYEKRLNRSILERFYRQLSLPLGDVWLELDDEKEGPPVDAPLP
jgi:hypothetical protein